LIFLWNGISYSQEGNLNKSNSNPIQGNKLMKNIILTIVAALAVNFSAHAANIASDSAANYGGGWTSGSNGGSGFSSWTISTVTTGTSAYAGAFIGDPNGSGINFGTQAFGLYANGARPVSVDVSRSFTGGALLNGQKFSFQYAINWDADSGEKGFNLWTGAPGSGWLLNVKQRGYPGNVFFNYSGSSEEINTNIGYGTGPMTWTFEMLSATSLGVSATARDGSSAAVFNQTITIADAPLSFNFYASNMGGGDQRNPYFNNLSLVPEPSSSLLMGMGLAGLAVLRRTRKNA
jgi:hypothetical protein